MEKERNSDDILLSKCLGLIEEKLNWGKSDAWTTKDFETLHDKIFEETKVRLSLATLKRLWGKVKYANKPTTTTLNTIAQFVGFENWRAFVSSHDSPANAEIYYQDETPSINNKSTKPRSIFMFAVALLVISTGLYFILKKKDRAMTPNDFVFTSNKIVSKGLPNSVLFQYDATAAGESDTVYIQQSWNTKLRTQVSRNNKSHNSIYYRPGYFQAKLIVNNRIVKEHVIHIETDGWLPLIDQKEVPVYFTEGDARTDGALGLPMEKIASANISMQPEPPWVSYFYVKDFKELKINNFNFETTIKNQYKTGSGICQYSEIYILYESNALFIPLSIKGCVSNLKPRAGNINKLNLTALGCDFADWITVTCRVKNGHGEVFADEQLAFEFDIPHAEKLVGLVYRFQGTGSINSVQLSNETNEIVLEENF